MSARAKKPAVRPLAPGSTSPAPSDKGGRSPMGRRNASQSGRPGADDDYGSDGGRGRSPASPRLQVPRGITNIMNGGGSRSSSSLSHMMHGKVPKELKVDDCLTNMVNFVLKHGLSPLYGVDLNAEDLEGVRRNHLSEAKAADLEDLRERLRPEAKAAAQLHVKLPYVNRELAMTLAILSLYDLAVLVDDSISMEFEESGIRIEVLKSVLVLLAEVFEAMTVDGEKKRGIRSIRFLNDNSKMQDKEIGKDDIEALIDKHEFEGLTRIGTGLMQQILKPLLYKEGWKKEHGIARELKELPRPLLIMVVTDGAIEGEPTNRVKQAISSVIASLSKAGYPEDTKAVVFQFARVGNDPYAQLFLEKLDSRSNVSKIMDTLSSEDLVGEGGQEIKDEQRLLKLFLGPISTAYDIIASKKTGEVNNDNSDDDFDDENEEEDDFDGQGSGDDTPNIRMDQHSDDDFGEDD